MRAAARMVEVTALVRIAQREGAAMRVWATSDAARDEATDRYVSAVDQLVDQLGALDEAGLLEPLARHLEMHDRVSGFPRPLGAEREETGT